MTIRELLNQAAKKLETSTSPALDAEVLLSHLLDQPKEYLMMNPDKQISPKLEKEFHILITRRTVGWPVPYLTNKQEFLGHEFYVDKNVLIPRPETEGLVELVIKTIDKQKNLKILDIGTGSGAIIVSLAKRIKCELFASDISADALKIAKQNAKQHKVKVTFKQGSLMTPWKNQSFDIIVANLPYLAKETDRSTKFEPKNALVAKNKGLALFEQLFQQIPLSVKYIFLEIGHDQGLAIKKLATKWLPRFKTEISKDLSGKTRYAMLALKT